MRPFIIIFTTLFFISISSCSNGNLKQSISSMDEVSSTSKLMKDSVKLVKTASLNCKVSDINNSVKSISKLVSGLGGMVSFHNIESNVIDSKSLKVSSDSLLQITSYIKNAELTIKIPEKELEGFIEEIMDQSSFVNSSKMNVDDKSLEYLRMLLYKKTGAKYYSNFHPKKIKDVATIINLNNEGVDQEIATRQINQDVQFSTIEINLNQNPLLKKEMVANLVMSDFDLPFSKRLTNALNSGWKNFVDFFIMISELWVFIVLAILMFVGYKNLNGKRILSFRRNILNS